ncbi:putative BTB/POZ domain-containing protein At2g40440 [Brassica napus]|uniref:putative BTB/POZ domain-containing protein At2g40440 n=1 Tax=Brassica napus TaxID=3708 RepID=UPI0020796269|nr:putative BTB/POZ domain-containing protein At2g40440 [Brassica napus]
MTTENNLEIFLGGFAKVFNEQWQVDVRLKAGDSNESAAISANKLAARSEVFKKMLESDKFKGTADQIETVTLSELKQEELEALVGFIYNNRSVLSEKEKKHAQTLFVAADKYDIPHLRDLCRKELISSLKLANVINILELSLIPFDEALNDAATMFVVRNLLAICDTVEFRLFVGKNPDLTVDIMKSSKSRRWKNYYI